MKKFVFVILALTILCSSFTGCQKAQVEDVDLSSYSFINKTWMRQTDSCTETIYFMGDGECGYYCACGNPVNDDDLCEGYSLDPETMTIYYDFSEKTSETITKITVVSYDEESLVLDFDGDERVFEIEKEEEYTDSLSYSGKDYLLLEYRQDIFFYDLAYSVDYEEDEILPLSHDKWDLVFRDGDIFVLDSQAEDAIAYYADDRNFSWSVTVYPTDSEEEYSFPATLSEDDISYVYGMEDMERDTTLAFDDIEIFATLVKTSADGMISASTSLAYYDNCWYWRSEVIDESADGWPEYVVALPASLKSQIEKHFNNN